MEYSDLNSSCQDQLEKKAEEYARRKPLFTVHACGRRFYCESRKDAEFLACVLSFGEDAQVFEGSQPLTCFYLQRECKLMPNGFHWLESQYGQTMEEIFKFKHL